MKRKLAVLSLFILGFAAAGYAQGNSSGELLDILLKNGTLTQEQYNSLKEETSAEEDTRSFDQDYSLDTNGGIKVSTYDGKYAFELGGRFFVDTAFYKENLNVLGNGTEIRSARLGIEGVIAFDWDYELDLEFRDSEAEIMDAYLDYRDWNGFSLKFGQFKPSFSLEQMGSRNHITFMERALVNEFVPDRRIGAQAKYFSGNWTAAAGFFGQNYAGKVDDEGDEGWSIIGRFTYAPFHSDTKVLHFGVSTAFRNPDDEKEIKFKRYPETHITSMDYLNTDDIEDVNDVENYGFESVFVYGPFSVQGEYIRTVVRLDEDEEYLDFYGGYAFVSWMITGESRDYKFKKGSFGRIAPNNSYGAFEVAVRYSTMDLNDFPDITGGRERNITFGLNWYANKYIRMMFNYVHINNDITADDNEDVPGNDDFDVFQTRMQISF